MLNHRWLHRDRVQQPQRRRGNPQRRPLLFFNSLLATRYSAGSVSRRSASHAIIGDLIPNCGRKASVMDLTLLKKAFLFVALKAGTAAIPYVWSAGQTAVAAVTSERSANLNIEQSLGKIGTEILQCYHPTGKIKSVRVSEAPWPDGRKFNAEISMLLEISWSGAVFATDYSMLVAVLSRHDMVKVVIQRDDAYIPRSYRCNLGEWQLAKATDPVHQDREEYPR